MLLRSFAFAAAAILSSIGVQAAYSSDGPNVMYYWGQDSADGKNTQSSLATYCKSGLADAYLISFLNKFNIGGLPGMNLAGTCETKFDGTKLLDCPDVGEDIKTCQSLGIKIILSLGGDEGSYGFKSDSEAETFAETIWDLFGGGSSDTRPFGDAQIDGIDLDIEGGASTGYATFVTSLRSKFDSDFIIGAAPQCPFPDAVLGSVIDEVGFDYVNVQFYNNYCSAAGSSFNFDTWAEWAAKTSPNSNTKVYFTTPGSKTAAGTGYTGISTIETVVPTLASSYSGIYGGVSVWDVSEAWRNDDFVSDLYSIVHSSSGSGGSSKTTTVKHLTTTSTKHTSTKTTSTKKSTTTKKTSTKKTSTKKSSTRKSSTKKSSTKKSHTKKTHTKKTHTKKSHTKTKHTRSTHTKSTHTKSTHTKSTHTKSTHTKSTHTKTTHTKTTHTKTTHTKTTHTKTTSTATATATSGTCVTSGQSCPTQNQMICTTGGKYAVCDHSKWTIMPCPNGTTCIPTANGSSMYCGYSTGAANTCPVLTARSHLHNTLNRGGAVPKPYSVSNVNTQLVVDTATDTEFSAIINARKTITSPFKDSVTIQFTAPKNIKFTHATGGTVRQNGDKVRINLKQSFNESMAFVVDVKGTINSGVFVAPNPSSLRIK